METWKNRRCREDKERYYWHCFAEKSRRVDTGRSLPHTYYTCNNGRSTTTALTPLGYYKKSSSQKGQILQGKERQRDPKKGWRKTQRSAAWTRGERSVFARVLFWFPKAVKGAQDSIENSAEVDNGERNEHPKKRRHILSTEGEARLDNQLRTLQNGFVRVSLDPDREERARRTL